MFWFWWDFWSMAFAGYLLATGRYTGILLYFLIFVIVYFAIRVGEIIGSGAVVKEIKNFQTSFREGKSKEFQRNK